MKILILMLLMAAQANAGWFSDDDQRYAQYEQQLASERQSSGDWQIIAGVFCIGGVVLFTIGTALGSKTKRDNG